MTPSFPKSELTCVTSYFRIKNKHGNQFNDWFKNTLSIKCPYVFFVNKESAELVKQYRQNLPTFYIEMEIEDFYTYKFKDKMVVDATHCPSIELNLIWNEKIFMIQKAFELNPFNSEWFKWIDAGICLYREIKPPNHLFPKNVDKMKVLPKDKFIFSSSTEKCDINLVNRRNYYHHISGCFILHGRFVNCFAYIYKQYLDELVDKNNIWTEQVVLTHIYRDNPNMFYKLGHGYGEITRYLFT